MFKGLLKTSLAPWACTACALLLSACGQKGPLTLPPPDAPATRPAAAPLPAPATATPAASAPAR